MPGRLATAARSLGGYARHSRKSIQQFCDHMVEPSATQARRGALSGQVSRIYFRADAAFAMPEVYEFLEAKRIKYAIRLPANQVLQSRIGYLLTRPVGRPPHHVRRFHANFSYQAGTWTTPRRVIAKVEWHPGELYPRVGFIVTNMSRPAKRVVAFYNKRGTCEQWIKEGKGAIKWTRLSCRTFAETRCGFSFMRLPTTSPTSCGRWRRRNL